MLSNKEIELYDNNMHKYKHTCKHCGHKKIIPKFVDKQICNWCGHYVYRNDEIERREIEKKKRSFFKRNLLNAIEKRG